MRKTAIGSWFDRIVCAEEVGGAKEHPVFWDKLEGMLNFDRKRTLLADDTAKVLRSAREYGDGFSHLCGPAQFAPASTLLP